MYVVNVNFNANFWETLETKVYKFYCNYGVFVTVTRRVFPRLDMLREKGFQWQFIANIKQGCSWQVNSHLYFMKIIYNPRQNGGRGLSLSLFILWGVYLPCSPIFLYRHIVIIFPWAVPVLPHVWLCYSLFMSFCFFFLFYSY